LCQGVFGEGMRKKVPKVLKIIILEYSKVSCSIKPIYSDP